MKLRLLVSAVCSLTTQFALLGRTVAQDEKPAEVEKPPEAGADAPLYSYIPSDVWWAFAFRSVKDFKAKADALYDEAKITFPIKPSGGVEWLLTAAKIKNGLDVEAPPSTAARKL